TARLPSSRRLARQAARRLARSPMWARPSFQSPARKVSAPARLSPLTAARTLKLRLSLQSPAGAADLAAAESVVAEAQLPLPRRSQWRTQSERRSPAAASL